MNTIKALTLRLNHKTVLPNKENRIKEIKRGQKDDCTAKNGLINIYSVKDKEEI